MTHAQQTTTFLAARTRLVRSWRYVGVLLLLVWAGSTAGLISFSPLLCNPMAALARVQANTYEPASLRLAAVMLPIMSLLCLGLGLILILFCFVVMRHERKYLAIIAELQPPSPPTTPDARENT